MKSQLMKIETVFSENILPLQKSFKNIVKPVRAHAYNSALYALALLTHQSGGKSKVCYKLQKVQEGCHHVKINS